MSIARVLLLALMSLALLGTGCGGSGSTDGEPTQQSVGGGGGDNELSASDTADVLSARRTIDSRCGGAAEPLDESLSAAVQTLTNVTRLYPARVYETGDSDRATEMRSVAEQVSAQLKQCGIAGEAGLLERAAGAS